MVSRIHPKYALVWACLLHSVWLLTAGGCRLPSFPLFAFLTPREESHKLRSIDGIALKKESTSRPKRLDEAATKDSKTGPGRSTEELPPPAIPPSGSNASPDETQSKKPVVPPVERLVLTLADARASALEANLDLKVEEVNPAIARQAISEEAGKFEATFNSTYVRKPASIHHQAFCSVAIQTQRLIASRTTVPRPRVALRAPGRAAAARRGVGHADRLGDRGVPPLRTPRPRATGARSRRTSRSTASSSRRVSGSGCRGRWRTATPRSSRTRTRSSSTARATGTPASVSASTGASARTSLAPSSRRWSPGRSTRMPDFRCDPAGAVHYDTTGVINGMKRLRRRSPPASGSARSGRDHRRHAEGDRRAADCRARHPQQGSGSDRSLTGSTTQTQGDP